MFSAKVIVPPVVKADGVVSVGEVSVLFVSVSVVSVHIKVVVAEGSVAT